MKLSQLRNDKSLNSFKSINFEDDDHYVLLDMLTKESLWLRHMSSYHPGIQNYVFGKYYDCQNALSNYKNGHVTDRTRKMSYYKEHYYLLISVYGNYIKLSKFKK